MRFEDIKDYFKLRGMVTNPVEALRFRTKQQPGENLVVKFKGGNTLTLRGGMVDYHLFHRIFLRDEYRLLGLPPGGADCILDLGGNVGIFSLRASIYARRVIAYEPFPGNFAILRENTSDLSQVEAVQEAVDGEAGTLELFAPVDENHSGSYSVHLEEGRLDGEKSTKVKATTLAELFAKHEIERCDLIKIDVEGAEYSILYKCDDQTLARIDRIHGEYHKVDGEENTIAKLVEFLTSKGFLVETIPHRRKENHGMFYAGRW